MKTTYFFLCLFLAFAGFLMTSCYKTFDPKSYAPAFSINGFSAVNQIEPQSLIDYWGFEGSLIDSVSGSTGISSGTTFVNGFIGQALGLNSTSSSYVTATPPPSLIGVQSCTVSFWVNPTFVDSNNDGSIDGILGLVNLSNVSNFWGNFDTWVENGSTLASSIIKVHITSGPTQDIFLTMNGVPGLFGKWSNHTITYDAASSNITYYINGSVAIAATKAPWTGPMAFTNSGPLVFGCVQFMTTPSLTSGTTAQSWASYLTGSLDEVRIYNTALSPAEVNAMVVLQGKNGK